jgi:hypothetical protein
LVHLTDYGEQGHGEISIKGATLRVSFARDIADGENWIPFLVADADGNTTGHTILFADA